MNKIARKRKKLRKAKDNICNGHFWVCHETPEKQGYTRLLFYSERFVGPPILACCLTVIFWESRFQKRTNLRKAQRSKHLE